MNVHMPLPVKAETQNEWLVAEVPNHELYGATHVMWNTAQPVEVAQPSASPNWTVVRIGSLRLHFDTADEFREFQRVITRLRSMTKTLLQALPWLS